MKAFAIIAVLLVPSLLTGPDRPRSDQEDEFGHVKTMVLQRTEEIAGSVHDFTDPATGWGDACRACHVPHLQAYRPSIQPEAEAPFEVYRIKGQRQVFEPDRYTPGPTSLICLGCHDGTVATSTIGGAHSMLAGVREGFAMPDGFVWRDHPIGIPYPTERGEYHPESFVTGKGIRLPEGRIECVSCHDPHDEAGHKAMLVMSNRRSALCLMCHIK